MHGFVKSDHSTATESLGLSQEFCQQQPISRTTHLTHATHHTPHTTHDTPHTTPQQPHHTTQRSNLDTPLRKQVSHKNLVRWQRRYGRGGWPRQDVVRNMAPITDECQDKWRQVARRTHAAPAGPHCALSHVTGHLCLRLRLQKCVCWRLVWCGVEWHGMVWCGMV